MTPKVRKSRQGVQMVQHGCVLSELLDRPGPTHSVFDVLAAAVKVFSPGGRVAMLGFAGGGMLAPLRKLGGTHEVHGVDLSEEGFRLYRKVTGDWGGPVRFDKVDAVKWMGRQRDRFDAIVEDLSVPLDGDVVKPAVSWVDLPDLMQKKTVAGGVVIANLLPTPGLSWREMIASCCRRPGVMVEFDGFYNRVLVQGRDIGGAREAGARLRDALRKMGSDLASGVGVRNSGR